MTTDTAFANPSILEDGDSRTVGPADHPHRELIVLPSTATAITSRTTYCGREGHNRSYDDGRHVYYHDNHHYYHPDDHHRYSHKYRPSYDSYHHGQYIYHTSHPQHDTHRYYQYHHRHHPDPRSTFPQHCAVSTPPCNRRRPSNDS
jgi:hypothetical protein